jgi:hypothetical protein
MLQLRVLDECLINYLSDIWKILKEIVTVFPGYKFGIVRLICWLTKRQKVNLPVLECMVKLSDSLSPSFF